MKSGRVYCRYFLFTNRNKMQPEVDDLGPSSVLWYEARLSYLSPCGIEKFSFADAVDTFIGGLMSLAYDMTCGSYDVESK